MADSEIVSPKKRAKPEQEGNECIQLSTILLGSTAELEPRTKEVETSTPKEQRHAEPKEERKAESVKKDKKEEPPRIGTLIPPRLVPPSTKESTRSLVVQNLVRPFVEKHLLS